MSVRLARFSYAWRRSGRYDSSAVVSVNSSASGTDCVPISWLTLRNAASIDMPDSTQISSRSSASGKARRIDNCRRAMRFLRKQIRHADIGGDQAQPEFDDRGLIE